MQSFKSSCNKRDFIIIFCTKKLKKEITATVHRPKRVVTVTV
nr:MAG TPA: hypothetical protein [Caudoviricetes sp.]